MSTAPETVTFKTRVQRGAHYVHRLVRLIRRQPVCEEPGCSNKPERFDLEETECWLCYDHAGKAGFCWSCGGFFAGCWEFDTHPTGLCMECDEQLKRDSGYYDDEEDY